MRGLALARPDLGLSLSIDGREALRLPPDPDLETRFRTLFQYQGRLLSLDGPGVAGFLLEPGVPPGKVRGLRILVNGRVVRIPALVTAIAKAMSGFLMQGRRPAGLLSLEMQPSEVESMASCQEEVRLRDFCDS